MNYILFKIKTFGIYHEIAKQNRINDVITDIENQTISLIYPDSYIYKYLQCVKYYNQEKNEIKNLNKLKNKLNYIVPDIKFNVVKFNKRLELAIREVCIFGDLDVAKRFRALIVNARLPILNYHKYKNAIVHEVNRYGFAYCKYIKNFYYSIFRIPEKNRQDALKVILNRIDSLSFLLKNVEKKEFCNICFLVKKKFVEFDHKDHIMCTDCFKIYNKNVCPWCRTTVQTVLV